jgi:hypothetical protein
MKLSFFVLLTAIIQHLPALESFVTYRTTTAPFVTMKARPLSSSVFDEFGQPTIFFFLINFFKPSTPIGSTAGPLQLSL